MRPPWIEATALLAAAGHRAGPPPKPLHPLTRSLLLTLSAHPSGEADRRDLVPYAFAGRLDGITKPRAFANVAGLARHIEGLRHGQAMQLVDVEDIEIPGRDGLYTGVQVWTQLIDGSRDRCLGWAWLDGHGRDRLEPALRAVRRDRGRAEDAEAA